MIYWEIITTVHSYLVFFNFYLKSSFCEVFSSRSRLKSFVGFVCHLLRGRINTTPSSALAFDCISSRLLCLSSSISHSSMAFLCLSSFKTDEAWSTPEIWAWPESPLWGLLVDLEACGSWKYGVKPLSVAVRLLTREMSCNQAATLLSTSSFCLWLSRVASVHLS